LRFFLLQSFFVSTRKRQRNGNIKGKLNLDTTIPLLLLLLRFAILSSIFRVLSTSLVATATTATTRGTTTSASATAAATATAAAASCGNHNHLEQKEHEHDKHHTHHLLRFLEQQTNTN
jgi:hypothetical protein